MGQNNKIQNDAESRRLELLLGLATKADVVAWADDVIMHLESPPCLIYDVSLAGCKTNKDLLSLLGALAGDVDKAEPHAAAFRRLSQFLLHNLEVGALSADQVAAKLHHAYYRTDLCLPEGIVLECDRFEDEFDCVRQGILEREPMEEELKRFLVACSSREASGQSGC